MGVAGSRLGVKHWIFQRVSNALLIIFGIFLAAVLVSGVSFDSLQALLGNTLVKVYLAITLLFAFGNSILAGWQITGDYAKKLHLPPTLMIGFCVIVSAAYLIAGLLLIF